MKAKKDAATTKAKQKKLQEAKKKAEEDEEDQQGEDAEEGAEEEDETDDEIVEVEPKKKAEAKPTQSMDAKVKTKEMKAPASKEKEKTTMGPQRRFVEPDLDDADEMREKYLKKLLQGEALEAQCLELSSGIVTGHVLFQVLDLQRCQDGVIAEVAFLAKKGATPVKAKLAQRGSGILIHLCAKSSCKKSPLQAKSIDWRHFSSWRPVKRKETKQGWMQTAASKKWRISDVTVLKMGKVSAPGKRKSPESESEEEDDASEEEDEDEEDEKEPDKKKPRSSVVMERLAEKIQSLEDAEKTKEPKKKKRKTDESEDEVAKVEKKKVTVEDLKARLKAVRDLQQKEQVEEKEKQKKNRKINPKRKPCCKRF